MHGIIHLELRNFVTQGYGQEAWQTLTERAGLAGEVYTPLQTYPDEHVVRLVEVAAEMTSVPATQLLEAFGEFLVPRYLALYGNLLKPEWRTLDILESTEQTIHRVVRLRQPGALPPRLRAERVAPNEVVLTYDSPRRLCAVARGISRGVARHFNEELVIDESSCMLKGDPACVLRFRVPPGSRATLRPT